MPGPKGILVAIIGCRPASRPPRSRYGQSAKLLLPPTSRRNSLG